MTWIEAAAKGRGAGPVRAGMWSSVVVGTHPIQTGQEVWLEIQHEEVGSCQLPAFWVENKGINSLWHVPIPPLPVNTRLRYRSGAKGDELGDEVANSNFQEVLVRPNLPEKQELRGQTSPCPEGLIGNRMMTARVDQRGATFDVYYPTVGLHSDVRPANGSNPQSRCHFRAIQGGLALGGRVDWFSEQDHWEIFQHYRGTTNLLVTELNWRHGLVRVEVVDFVATGPSLPRTAGATASSGQYLKRFRIINETDKSIHPVFGLYVHAVVNGGIGEPGLIWIDGESALLASNRGHGHSNRKLARDSTVEFALALSSGRSVHCEAVGPNEAMLTQALEIPEGETGQVDLLVSGAFTGWKADQGTFDHWLKPSLAWFRGADLDVVEQESSRSWEEFVTPIATPRYLHPIFNKALKRSVLAAALHADAEWGSIAAGYDRGIKAYCYPRDAIYTALALGRAGQPTIPRRLFEWLNRVSGKYRSYRYWFHKYSIDGWPEWETPAVDQTALIPWALERHYRGTGELGLIAEFWPMIEQAAEVCLGRSGHPGLHWDEKLSLIRSAGMWGHRFGAFLYSNVAVVAGLRSAVRLSELLGRKETSSHWSAMADRIWHAGILGQSHEGYEAPGLIDPASGRFLESRQQSLIEGFWTQKSEITAQRSGAMNIGLLSPAIPFGLLDPANPHLRASAEAILRHNPAPMDPNALARWAPEPEQSNRLLRPAEAMLPLQPCSLATLWMARYLIALGKATGEGSAWTRAVALIEDILGRLGPLGLSMRTNSKQDDDPSNAPTIQPGVWSLHAMLIDAILDLGGIDYDASLKRLILSPVLPPAWNSIGLTQSPLCGEVSYRLERVLGGSFHRLTLEARLKTATRLEVDVTCPGLRELGPWSSRSSSTQVTPQFSPSEHRVTWKEDLAAGLVTREWTWG